MQSDQCGWNDCQERHGKRKEPQSEDKRDKLTKNKLGSKYKKQVKKAKVESLKAELAPAMLEDPAI